MADRPTSNASTFRSLVLIAIVVIALVAAFAFTAGWLSPGRLTPAKIVNGLAPPGGAALGFRRNHAKGICFTGSFESNGGAAALSKAPMFAPGSYPVTGRFNLATADPKASDATVRVRGLSLRIVAPNGSEWRTAMIDAPFFPVATPQAFYESAAGLGQRERSERDEEFHRRAPGVRHVRRVGRQRAVDRVVRAGPVQQPQQLHLHQCCGRRPGRALVLRAHRAARGGIALTS